MEYSCTTLVIEQAKASDINTAEAEKSYLQTISHNSLLLHFRRFFNNLKLELLFLQLLRLAKFEDLLV